MSDCLIEYLPKDMIYYTAKKLVDMVKLGLILILVYLTLLLNGIFILNCQLKVFFFITIKLQLPILIHRNYLTTP